MSCDLHVLSTPLPVLVSMLRVLQYKEVMELRDDIIRRDKENAMFTKIIGEKMER
jgi:hypothetical protein